MRGFEERATRSMGGRYSVGRSLRGMTSTSMPAFRPARKLPQCPQGSVHIVVTSPTGDPQTRGDPASSFHLCPTSRSPGFQDRMIRAARNSITQPGVGDSSHTNPGMSVYELERYIHRSRGMQRGQWKHVGLTFGRQTTHLWSCRGRKAAEHTAPSRTPAGPKEHRRPTISLKKNTGRKDSLTFELPEQAECATLERVLEKTRKVDELFSRQNCRSRTDGPGTEKGRAHRKQAGTKGCFLQNARNEFE